MRYPYRVLGVLAVSCALLGDAAVAVAPLSGAELRRLCAPFPDAPYSGDGIACSAYIHGFIGGAHATGRRAEKQQAESTKERGGFVERATRTRIPTWVGRFGKHLAADYCIPQEVPLTTIVQQVVDYLNTKPTEDDTPAHALVLGALNHHYHCAPE